MKCITLLEGDFNVIIQPIRLTLFCFSGAYLLKTSVNFIIQFLILKLMFESFCEICRFLFVLCGKPFQVCKAWKVTLKSIPVHSFNGVIISSARVCTLQLVFAFPLLLVPFYFFSSSWCRGSAVASAFGFSWAFLLTILHVTPVVFLLCGKSFQLCKAWKGTLKSFPVHSFNSVIISSARVCTLQLVFAFPLLLVSFYFFSSSWFRGLAAASACRSSWTFLFTFLV